MKHGVTLKKKHTKKNERKIEYVCMYIENDLKNFYVRKKYTQSW